MSRVTSDASFMGFHGDGAVHSTCTQETQDATEMHFKLLKILDYIFTFLSLKMCLLNWLELRTHTGGFLGSPSNLCFL